MGGTALWQLLALRLRAPPGRSMAGPQDYAATAGAALGGVGVSHHLVGVADQLTDSALATFGCLCGPVRRSRSFDGPIPSSLTRAEMSDGERQVMGELTHKLPQLLSTAREFGAP
jgi:hypothetical protein